MSDTAKSMRLFVGLPLAPSAQRSLLELSRQLRGLSTDARWVSGDRMHITLFFLGDTQPERVSEIISALKEIHSHPLELTIDGTGGFERAGIFFAAVHPSPKLVRLASEVKDKLMRCGFSSKESEYRPHITLARTRHGLKQLLITAQNNHNLHASFTADRFNLYRSHLSKEGSHYEVIQEFPFVNENHTV